MDERKRGFLLVLGTAMISGLSIFINKFAVAQFDPFVFTALKNSAVCIAVLSFIYLSSRARELMRMPKVEWTKLAAWGAFDGGMAFLLYFYGLKMASAATASLMQKSMFIFASALAFVFLNERMNIKQIAAAMVLLVGAALLSDIQTSSMGMGEVAVMGAVLLWSAGNVVCKKLLEGISATNVVFGRMFFGSLLMLGLLAATGNSPNFSSFTFNHYAWLLLTAALLLAYQLTYYNGLRVLSVSEATSILVLGAVVTPLLSMFIAEIPSPSELLGVAAVIAGCILIYLTPAEVEDVHNKTVQSC